MTDTIRQPIDIHTPETPFPELLAHIGDVMRQYDAIATPLEVLNSQIADAKKKLEGIDVMLPAEDQDEEVARAALKVYLGELRASPMRMEQARITYLHSSPALINFIGRKATVQLKPEYHDMDLPQTSDRNRAQLIKGIKGRVISLSFEPTGGGYIALLNGWAERRVYAQPLVSRQQDYQPLFDVTLF
jgi:hypothetical protein